VDRDSIRKAPITTAIFLALASTFGFGVSFVLTQFGLRWMPSWLGVAISIPTSTLLFWCLGPFFVDPSGGNLKALALFACVGLFFPGTVALLNFESNRLMGPNIAGALSRANFCRRSSSPSVARGFGVRRVRVTSGACIG
jgi:hypothetical protein